jgi:hypothetical protein
MDATAGTPAAVDPSTVVAAAEGSAARGVGLWRPG